MLEIDGSEKSGSGTILRLSVALASIIGKELHIYNIRKRRSQPGLRPQHLEAVLTAAKLCDGKLEGATLNSQELWFQPGKIVGGRIEAEIGTAGSISMLLLTILPICTHAEEPVQVHVMRGGTDVRHAPTINYLKQVFLPVLARMGVQSSLQVHRYGYYPKGMGEVTLTVHPQSRLLPLRLNELRRSDTLHGISVCTFLEERRVADRQAEAALKYLKARGFRADFEVVYDASNSIQRGSSLVLWTETDSGTRLGGDAIGAIRKSSEAVGREAAQNILQELEVGATVDVHLADMLVPFVALAGGESVYLTRSITEHLETNIWFAQEILGTEFAIEKAGRLYRVKCGGR